MFDLLDEAGEEGKEERDKERDVDGEFVFVRKVHDADHRGIKQSLHRVSSRHCRVDKSVEIISSRHLLRRLQKGDQKTIQKEKEEKKEKKRQTD